MNNAEQELILACESFIESSEGSANESTRAIASACETVLQLTKYVN